MDLSAIEQAGARLERAEEALIALQAAQDYSSAEKAWTDFLLAANAFFSKLEQGAKCAGKSAAWFGEITRLRKDDPVLRYIHFARNSDEHGIARVTDRTANSGLRGGTIGFGQQTPTTVCKVDPTTLEPTGPEVRAWMYGARIKAVPTRNRGVVCTPPNGHIGDRDGSHPQDIAAVAIQRLWTILEEASDLV